MKFRIESKPAAVAGGTWREAARLCPRGITVANPRPAPESVGAIWSMCCAAAGHTASANAHTTAPRTRENDLPIHKSQNRLPPNYLDAAAVAILLDENVMNMSMIRRGHARVGRTLLSAHARNWPG